MRGWDKTIELKIAGTDEVEAIVTVTVTTENGLDVHAAMNAVATAAKAIIWEMHADRCPEARLAHHTDNPEKN